VGDCCTGRCTKGPSPPLPTAGLPHEWSVEKYGELLTTGGGKERMSRYFKVPSIRLRAMQSWQCSAGTNLECGVASAM
jgi:hypothetical protein